jgi:hypothetical protein
MSSWTVTLSPTMTFGPSSAAPTPDPLLALQPGLIEAEELDWRTENPMALCAGSMIQVPAGTS